MSHLPLIAQRAVEEGYDMVVVGGGDGTVSEVAKGLLHAPIRSVLYLAPIIISPSLNFDRMAEVRCAGARSSQEH